MSVKLMPRVGLFSPGGNPGPGSGGFRTRLSNAALPRALSLHRRLAVQMRLASCPDELGETDRRLGHKRVFRHDTMRNTLEQAGFEVIEQFGMICKALPNILLANCNDDQLRGLFELGCALPIEYSGAIGFIAKSKA